MSIRYKLIIMFLAIAVIPLLFVSILTFHNYKNSLQASYILHLRNLATFKAERIETYFSGLKEHIEIAQGFYNIKKNLPVLSRLADAPKTPEFLAAKKMLSEQLQQMQSVSGLSDIMLVNPEGKVVYANKPGHYSKDLFSTPSDVEQKAFTEGRDRIYFSDVYFDKKEDNRYEMLVTAPASGFNGNFIGVIAFEVDMAPVHKLIQDATGLGKTGEVLVGKKSGNEVVYLNSLRHEPNTIMKRINIGEEAGGPIQEAVQGINGAGQLIDYRGKRVIAAWRYIPSLDWGMVAKIDTKEAFADVTNLRNLMAVILVMVIVLSGATAFSVSQSISEPIKQLSEGAEIIGRGNLDYKVGINLKDEIGQLSRSFDKMTVDLKQTTASRNELSIEVRERKEAEAALRESEGRERERATELAALLDAAPTPVFIAHDPDCRHITGNVAADELLRNPRGGEASLTAPDEVRPRHFRAFKDGRELSNDELPAQRAARGIPVENFEFSLVFDDGTIRHVLGNGKPLLNEAGQPRGSVLVLTDITERKRAEEALRENEIKYRTVADNTYDWEFWLDPEGRFLYCSPSCERITGHRPEEFLADPDLRISLIHPDDQAQFEKHLREVEHKQKGVSKGEWRYIRPDGTICWVAHICQPVYDDSGQFLGIRGSNRDITERKGTEEELRESREDLKRAQAVAHTGSWRINIQRNELTWSDEGYRIFGIPKGTPMTYESFLDYVHPEDRKGVNVKWKEALRGKGYDIEYRIVADGKIKWVRAKAELEFDKDGTLLGGFGTVADITERKEMEEALREAKLGLEDKVEERTAELAGTVSTLRDEVRQRIAAEETLRSASLYARGLLEASPDPLVTISADGEITDVNDATIKVTGVSREKLIGTDFSNYFTEPKKAREGYRKVFAEGFVTDYPLTIKHRQGRLTDVIYNAAVYKNEAGEVQGVFAAARDVTAQRQASQYARSLIESSLDPLVTISADGKITDVNDATIKVTGISREQLIGTDFSDYFTEPEKAREGYQQVFAEGFVTDYPLTIRHKKGRLTDVLYNATVYKDTHGNVAGVFAAARDITEKKAAEAKLEEYRQHLEDEVKQRTEELARSNRDLEQFAYVASHDLQEPLRAVAGFVGLLRMQLRDSLDAKKLEYMNFATDGVSRMQSLISGLLEYSRVGTREKEPEMTDSKAALGRAIAHLGGGIREFGAKITIADGMPKVCVDATQLTQLFQNLIGNAIKFCDKEAPQVHISAVREDSAWRFAVADNGIGIEPQYTGRIFQIFQRLHSRDKYPGTGIGLAICKKIVERHGGKIWVESKIGAGSTFYFTIPDKEEA